MPCEPVKLKYCLKAYPIALKISTRTSPDVIIKTEINIVTRDIAEKINDTKSFVKICCPEVTGRVKLKYPSEVNKFL